MNTFSHGIHTDCNKELSKNVSITSMPTPKMVYVPLVQHIGAPAKCIVSVGDHVLMGQKIGEAAGAISANIFSPCSGVVKDVLPRVTPNGKCDHVIIENDFSDKKVSLPPLVNPNHDEILQRLTDCGIVGMGGAGFPTAVKLSPKEKIEYFIINAAECEPYITCDYRIMLEYTVKFLSGALMLAKTVGLDNVIIGIEDNKPDVIEHLNKVIAENNFKIAVVVCKTKYPQGAEKQLIYAITKRKVPVGKLPCAVGVVVNNVHTALSAYLAVAEGEQLYRRILTVTGGGITKPSNMWVSVGSLYSDIINYCGGLSQKPTVKMISGGPMMGMAVLNDACSSTKTTSCILLMTSDEAFTGTPSACINCGRCARACPMKLMPMYIDSYSLAGDLDNAVKYGALNCIECGCCAYVCPAKRPLTQSIKLAKKKYNDKKKKQQEANK